MNNWLNNMGRRLAQFMVGRYGPDELNQALLIAAIVMTLLGSFPFLGKHHLHRAAFLFRAHHAIGHPRVKHQYDFLPGFLKEKDWEIGEKIFEFNRRIVDATIDQAACYKVQIACYEALGLAGMACFAKTLQYIRKNGAIVISDVKRGDIASTAKQYAVGHFTGDFETDIITVNGYMGEDAISPYYDFLKKDSLAVNSFRGEYMAQYSWAEMTVGSLFDITEAGAAI